MRILLAEGDVYLRGFLVAFLRDRGCEVVPAADTAEMLVRLRGGSFAAVVVDQALAGIHPLELLPGLRMAWPDTPVILLGPSGDDACRQAALENGAHAVLAKPVEPNDLVRTLRAVASAPATLSSTLVSTEGGARRPGSRDGRSGVMRRADERRAGARARSHQGGNGRAPAYRG